MVSVRAIAFAGVGLFATAAHAADMPQLMPPPPMPYHEDFARGWYLRGDIGMTNQQVKSLDNVSFPGTPNLVIQDKNFESGMLFGIGIGYQFNNWLRVRCHRRVSRRDRLPRARYLDRLRSVTRASRQLHSQEVRVARARQRLCRSRHLGFVHAVRRRRHRRLAQHDSQLPRRRASTSSLADVGLRPRSPRSGISPGRIHAGIAYKITPNATIEFAYRYVDLGDALSGDIETYSGLNSINNPMHFKDITSHDVKFGVRWLLDSGPKYEPMPSYPPAHA